jgi:hypothetical protein
MKFFYCLSFLTHPTNNLAKKSESPMLKLLPRLPFVCAFDILFRHGGIASGLQCAFPSGVALFEFLKQTFGDTLWTEIICACHLVFSLEHPAHVLYLLHPIDKTIPESVGAWSVSSEHSDAPWALPIRRDLMILSMRVFLAKGPVYDWLDSWDLKLKRTTQEWVDFALECIHAHRFTTRWWRTQEGIARWEHDTMGQAIFTTAQDERARLETALLRKERMRLLEVKRAKRVGSEGKQRPVRLTVYEEECAKINGEQQFIKYRNLLQELKSILNDKLPTARFDAAMPEVARLVMALAKKYRKMRWSLKAVFHNAAADRLGYDVWRIERELCRQETYRVLDPLLKLRMLR